jgi:hypothetical protein
MTFSQTQKIEIGELQNDICYDMLHDIQYHLQMAEAFLQKIYLIWNIDQGMTTFYHMFLLSYETNQRKNQIIVKKIKSLLFDIDDLLQDQQ